MDSPPRPAPTLGRGFLFLLSFASAATVANLFYNQPLLAEIADQLHVGPRAVGFVPSLSQAGYAVGLLLVVPLGDSRERRRIVLTLNVLVAFALLATGFATNVPLLLVASFAVGATTIVPQLLIPFAAGLVPVTERGRVVGSIQGGLLIGVLLSRTISGWVGAHFGWRSMFVIAAVLMLALFAVLYRLLPAQPPAAPTPYLPLLRSLWTLWREEPLIRLHATLGALTFAGFSAFWATLALQLDALPAHYGPAVAGTFGLVGVVGASAAPVVGRFADRTADKRIQVVGISAVLVAFALFWIGGSSLVGLAAGVILLDFGAQANHVANQARIFTLRTEAHSRVNTLYMTTYIGGGALGAYLGALGFARFGWPGVCAVGGGAALLGLLRVAVPLSAPPPAPA